MTLALFSALAAAAAWLTLAVALPHLHIRNAPRAFRALVAAGVPVLGWLTLNCGPVIGLTGFALGLATLLRTPRRHNPTHGLPPLE